jgi:hypothetical protein
MVSTRASGHSEAGFIGKHVDPSATLGSASKKLSRSLAIVDLALHTLDIYRLPE